MYSDENGGGRPFLLGKQQPPRLVPALQLVPDALEVAAGLLDEAPGALRAEFCAVLLSVWSTTDDYTRKIMLMRWYQGQAARIL